jgi:flavin reductase (DIM6/NTAB) family NADH-FMN oxidoreductase RutF
VGGIVELLSRVDRELWIVTAAAEARRGGLVATFVTPASIAEGFPRVLVGVARQHFTWELIESSGAFALHVIGEEHLEWVWRFGLASGRDGDKFGGLALRDGATGSPILVDALGWLDCRVEERMLTGDRTIYLAEVVAGGMQRQEAPLTMSRLLQRAAPEKLNQLKKQLERDAGIDAEAIRDWKEKRTAPAHRP